MEWKHTDSTVTKKIWVQWSVKKVILIVFWDLIGSMNMNFFEKGASVNSASYC